MNQLCNFIIYSPKISRFSLYPSADEGNASGFSAVLSKEFFGFAFRDTHWLALLTGGFLHGSKASREHFAECMMLHLIYIGKDRDEGKDDGIMVYFFGHIPSANKHRFAS